ncbi:MAG: hypothetical protein IPJ78_10330 [Gemmatimonadetes bacterium]|nr:hypothetical protein [Gemmatimonadota bacterium]
MFDNFETVSNPNELFRWIDTYIRPPNKVLITTRTRDFVGDYPIEVLGMTESEARELIRTTAQRLGVADLLSAAYVTELVSESGGHPYVLKILLGEVRSAGRASKPERIVADKEHILVALFERTYSSLSPSAQRLFLLLSRWRSAVPVLALEAVSLRSAEERLDIRAALSELTRFSLVEEWGTPDSDETFVSVPLAATRFGQKKLNASPWKATIELDFQLLQLFGAASRAESQAGVLPRIHRLLSALAREVAAGRSDLHAHRAMLSFIGSRAPASLPEIARLFVEEGSASGRRIAIDYLRQFIESGDSSLSHAEVWQQIASLSRAAGDSVNELRALAELATARGADAQQVSRAAFAVTYLLTEARKEGRSLVDNDERRLLLTAISRSLESLLDDLNATDHSRLAWIYLSLGNEARARDVVALGVQLEPENSHCRSLAHKLGVPIP